MSFSSSASRSSGEQPTHFQLTQYGSLNLPLPATHWAPWRWAYLRRKGEITMHSKTKRYHKHRVMKNEERGPLRAPKQTKRKVRDVTCTRVQVRVKNLRAGASTYMPQRPSVSVGHSSFFFSAVAGLITLWPRPV